jgi:hypothetical protein
MQVEERALLSVLYVRPLHILRIEVLQRSFESTLHATVGVMDASTRWPAGRNRLAQRAQREFRIDMPRHCPADDPARVQIQDYGEIDEAVDDADVAEVRRPRLVNALQALAGQQVRIHPMRVRRIRGHHKRAADLGVQRELPHHAAQTSFPDTYAAAAEIDLHGPVASPRKLALHTLDGIAQLGIFPFALLA